MMAGTEPLNESTGVTRQLLAVVITASLMLVSTVFALMESRISRVQADLARSDSAVVSVRERLSALEVTKGELSKLELRVSSIETRVNSLDSSMAAHRAATEGPNLRSR